jgi:hypothetical protein
MMVVMAPEEPLEPRETPYQRRTNRRLRMYKGVPTKEAPKRSRIKFTATDLRTATEVPTALIANNQAEATPDRVGEFMEELGTGGAFRGKIAAAASFGFVETGPERVTLTDWGVSAVNPETRIKAWRKAVMNVPLYRALVEKYSKEPLPDDVRLEEDLVRRGVVPASAQRARWMFMRSLEQAEMIPRDRATLLLPSDLDQEGPKPVVPPRDTRDTPFDEAEGYYARGARRSHEPPDSFADFADFDPLVAGLLRRLPKKGETWSRQEFERWLKAAEMNFGLVWDESE